MTLDLALTMFNLFFQEIRTIFLRYFVDYPDLEKEIIFFKKKMEFVENQNETLKKLLSVINQIEKALPKEYLIYFVLQLFASPYLSFLSHHKKKSKPFTTLKEEYFFWICFFVWNHKNLKKSQDLIVEDLHFLSQILLGGKKLISSSFSKDSTCFKEKTSFTFNTLPNILKFNPHASLSNLGIDYRSNLISFLNRNKNTWDCSSKFNVNWYKSRFFVLGNIYALDQNQTPLASIYLLLSPNQGAYSKEIFYYQKQVVNFVFIDKIQINCKGLDANFFTSFFASPPFDSFDFVLINPFKAISNYKKTNIAFNRYLLGLLKTNPIQVYFDLKEIKKNSYFYYLNYFNAYDSLNKKNIYLSVTNRLDIKEGCFINHQVKGFFNFLRLPLKHHLKEMLATKKSFLKQIF